jgi:hypothetical protein
MSREDAQMETRFLGSRKAKLWTFMFLGLLLVVGILVANYVLVDPDGARRKVDFIAGLPSWAFPLIGFGVGALFYWVGLKVETDWPEFLGALLIAASFAAVQWMIGWEHFELGGLTVIPYILPVFLFLVLLIISMVKSR